MKSLLRSALMAFPIVTATAAQAQPTVVADSGDSAWVLAASAIALTAVLPGLALFYWRGREGNQAINLVLSVAIASLVFAVIGYSLSFAEGSSLIGGSGNAFLGNMAELRVDTTISETVFALFQTVVAVFAIGILVAPIADKAKTGWLTGFVTLWILLVYAPLAHWIWGGGWLSELGVLDFGGGLVVQVAAGTSALVAAMMLGRNHEDDIADSRLTMIGVWLVWIGWLGLTGGFALGGSDDAATAMLNAHFAACAALLTGVGIARWRKIAVADHAGISAIAGLAAVSTGAAYVGTAGAIVLGLIGAIAASLGAMFVARLKIGNTASAFVSSGCGGIVGAVAFPVFVSPTFGGPGFDEGVGLLTQTIAQGVGVLVVILWSAVVTAIAGLMVSLVTSMREST